MSNTNEQKKYERFWDGSDPSWCLVELKSHIESTADYLIYNYHRPNERPMIGGCHLTMVITEMLRARVIIISWNEKLADTAREYSRRKRYSSLVIYGTFDYLLKGWEATVRDVALEKCIMFEEYLNDMNGRKILEELIEVAGDSAPYGVKEKMWLLDSKIIPLLQPSFNCIYGNKNALKLSYLPHQHWYYFALPKFIGTEWEQNIQRFA